MTDKSIKRFQTGHGPLVALCLLLSLGLPGMAGATAFVQCPGDNDGDAVVDTGNPNLADVRCMHLGAGDGLVTMADGRPLYMFGFVDLTGVTESQALDAGILASNFPSPTIVLDEGDQFYLTLTNYGMLLRPDLADPHTVHFHGFPNASSVFDGVPEASIAINMGASLTYYYNIVEPGTYMYHCHVEAAEHMQMGMLGNLYVRPAQNGTPLVFEGRTYDKFVYNDGDGSTGYDVEYPIQIGSWDPEFHDASMNVQPLPFADMKDTYGMLNGRGYPDTADARTFDYPFTPGSGANPDKELLYGTGKLGTSQPVSTRIEATAGQRILLRISNLNVTRFYTLTALGLPPMKVVGTGARILRGGGKTNGHDMYYDTSSVTLGGGESTDVIIDTAGVAPGTYFLYTTNLNYLSNNDEDFGGMMTEIHIM
jgi:FtsP/CotA-like multicopper oxidase with cupredoxin domain